MTSTGDKCGPNLTRLTYCSCRCIYNYCFKNV